MTDPKLITGVYSMPDEEYHADPCEVPALSFSIGWTLINETPAHAYMQHPKLGATPRQATVGMDEGTVAHALLLGAGRDKLAVLPYDDWRKADARAARDAAIACGKVPCKAAEFAECEAAAKVIAGRMQNEHGIVLRPERSERVLLWVEQTSDGEPVQCRAKIDNFDESTGSIVDIKKIKRADPRTIRQHIEAYGYHVQEAAYRSALSGVFPALLGRETFMRLFFEMSPPHPVTRDESAGSLRVLGCQLWQVAIDRWAACLRNDHWPAQYTPGGVTRTEASPWAMQAAEEMAANLEHAA